MIGDKQIKLITVTVTVAADKGSNTRCRRSLVRLLRIPILRKDLAVERPYLDRSIGIIKGGNLGLFKLSGVMSVSNKLSTGSIDNNTRLGDTTENLNHTPL